jgi:hypothetical protein
MPINADLVAAETVRRSLPNAARDEMLTTRPKRAAFMPGNRA